MEKTENRGGARAGAGRKRSIKESSPRTIHIENNLLETMNEMKVNKTLFVNVSIREKINRELKKQA